MLPFHYVIFSVQPKIDIIQNDSEEISSRPFCIPAYNGLNNQLHGVSSSTKLFAYGTVIVIGRLRVYCAFRVLVQTNFRRFLPDQSQILPDHFNVLDKLWGEISTGFDNRWRIGCFRQRYKVAESSQFLQWGSLGKFFNE